MVDITKRFPGALALDRAKLNVRHGTVHSLMGENGAGKSTLMKCLFGVYREDEGEIYIDGESGILYVVPEEEENIFLPNFEIKIRE